MKLVPRIDVVKDFGQTHVGLTPRVADIADINEKNFEVESAVPSSIVDRLEQKLPDANNKGVKLS